MDKETGYYFYNARHYDPEISRFVTADNVIDGELDTQGWNRFSYVKGNPIQYKDPTGHEGCSYGIGSAPTEGPGWSVCRSNGKSSLPKNVPSNELWKNKKDDVRKYLQDSKLKQNSDIYNLAQNALKDIESGKINFSGYTSYTYKRQYYKNNGEKDGEAENRVISGEYDPIKNKISIDISRDPKDIASTIIHEYSHYEYKQKGLFNYLIDGVKTLITGKDEDEVTAHQRQSLFNDLIGNKQKAGISVTKNNDGKNNVKGAEEYVNKVYNGNDRKYKNYNYKLKGETQIEF